MKEIKNDITIKIKATTLATGRGLFVVVVVPRKVEEVWRWPWYDHGTIIGSAGEVGAAAAGGHPLSQDGAEAHATQFVAGAVADLAGEAGAGGALGGDSHAAQP
jgi:hypothetical protein